MNIEKSNILVPVDFSENSDKAFGHILEIAKETASSITVLHVIQIPADYKFPDQESGEYFIGIAEQEVEELLDKFGQNKDNDTSGVKINTRIEVGNTVSTILDLSRSQEFDLIAMGTKGATGYKNLVLGSITTHIIKKSAIPVLAIPLKSTYAGMKQITFATDFKPNDLKALEKVVRLAEVFESSIDVVHVAETDDLASDIRFRGFREVVRENIPYKNISFHMDYETDFFPGISAYLDDHPSSLLVLVRYKKTFWEALSDRNHSREMALYANVPLLVLIGD